METITTKKISISSSDNSHTLTALNVDSAENNCGISFSLARIFHSIEFEHRASVNVTTTILY